MDDGVEDKCANTLFNRQNLPWISVKDSISYQGMKGFKISLNDVIKLGRIKLRLKEIKHNTDYIALGEVRGVQVVDKLQDELKCKVKRKAVCRICYCNEEEMSSDLIQPCLCSGSMKYIHFCCLQQWLKSKGIDKKTTTPTAITYSLKAIECELCKTALPDCIKQNGKIYNLFDFLNPDFNNYIIFEIITHDSTSIRSLVSIDISNKKRLKLGRGQDSDIRISDISVSRHHADMVLLGDDCNEVNLEDNKSKFGTLVYSFNSNMRVLEHMPYTVQVGRSLLRMTVVKSSCNLFMCFSKRKEMSKEEQKMDYQLQNFQYICREGNNCMVREIKTISNSMATESSIEKTNSLKLNTSVNGNEAEVKHEALSHRGICTDEIHTMEKLQVQTYMNSPEDSQCQIHEQINITHQLRKSHSLEIAVNNDGFVKSMKDNDFALTKDQRRVLAKIDLNKSGFAAITKKICTDTLNVYDKDELILSQIVVDGDLNEEVERKNSRSSNDNNHLAQDNRTYDRAYNSNINADKIDNHMPIRYFSCQELRVIKEDCEVDSRMFSSVSNNRESLPVAHFENNSHNNL